MNRCSLSKSSNEKHINIALYQAGIDKQKYERTEKKKITGRSIQNETRIESPGSLSLT